MSGRWGFEAYKLVPAKVSGQIVRGSEGTALAVAVWWHLCDRCDDMAVLTLVGIGRCI